MAERSRPTVALGLVGLIIAGLSLRNVPSVAQENPTTTGQAIVSVVTSTTQTSQVPAATNPPGTGLPTPQVYVKIAIDFIEQTAYRVPVVDWPAIRAKAEQQASNAASIEATYHRGSAKGPERQALVLHQARRRRAADLGQVHRLRVLGRMAEPGCGHRHGWQPGGGCRTSCRRSDPYRRRQGPVAQRRHAHHRPHRHR